MTSPGDNREFSHLKQGRARAAMAGVLWSGMTSLMPTLVAALVFLLTSRILQPTDFGLVAFAVALVATLAVFSPSGFSDAIVQHAELGRVHLDTVFWLCLGWGLMLYGIVLAVTPLLAEYYHHPMLAVLMPVLGVKVILDQLHLVPKALLSRSMSFRKIAMRATIASLIAAGLCLVVLFAGYGLWALVASQIASSLVTCLVSWLSVEWRPRLRFSRTAFRDLMRFGAYSSGSQMVTAINVDQLLIGSLLGPGALGIFGFARRLFQMITEVMTGALSAVTYPLLASMQKEREKLREAYLTATFLSSVLAFPAFVGLGLVADRMVPMVFGPQWVEAVTPLRAFCAIGLLTCIGVLQSSLIRSQGRAGAWMAYQVAQQILTAVVILATFRYGIGTVAVAMAVKTWIVWPFTTIFAASLIDLRPLAYLRQFLPPATACLAMAGLLIWLDSWLPATGAALAAMIVAGVAVYGAVVSALAYRRLKGLGGLVRRRKKQG